MAVVPAERPRLEWHCLHRPCRRRANDLVLTHYCMEGNQPRMRARNATGSRFDFQFDGGTNIDPRRDRHMHSASLELLGDDEIRTEWTELAEASPVLVVKSHLLRKAR